MLTCSDCKDDSCPEAGRDMNACENYSGDEVAEEPIDTELNDLRNVVIGLSTKVRLLEDEVEALSCKFFDILAAVNRAATNEEDR